MAVAKSILEVDIKDQAFKDFLNLFDRYSAQLKGMPGQWDKVNSTTEKSASIFTKIGEHLEKIDKNIEKAANSQQHFQSVTSGTAFAMGNVARHATSIAGSILSATTSMLKWGALTAGLLATGGIFGLDRLTGSASNLRRESKGAGVSSAELQAASISFGKYVDVESQLKQINEARNDVSKRGALAAAGLGSGAFQNMSNADFQANALKVARNTFIRSGGTRQGAESHGLLELFSFEELTRLKNTTEKEIDANVREYNSRKKLLELNDKQLKSWQDLSIQLDLSGSKIKNTFIDGLAPLAGPLAQLSDAIAEALKSMLGDKRLAGWIDDLGKAVKGFATYLKGDEFKSDIHAFWDGVKELSEAIVGLAKFINHPLDSTANWFDKLSDKIVKGINNTAPLTIPGVSGAANKVNGPGASGTGSSPRNNPGNLRPVGGGGFNQYNTLDDGLKAMGKQLQLYGNGGSAAAHHQHLDTIAQIVSTYAPAKDNNNVQSYIRDVVNRTGFGANQHLDLNDINTLSRLMSAMTKHENAKTNYSPDMIKQALSGQANYSSAPSKNAPQNATVITVNNNTGGNAIVSAAAMAH